MRHTESGVLKNEISKSGRLLVPMGCNAQGVTDDTLATPEAKEHSSLLDALEEDEVIKASPPRGRGA